MSAARPLSIRSVRSNGPAGAVVGFGDAASVRASAAKRSHLMPTSAFILSRYEDEKLERQVRWGILVIAALLLAIWLKS